MSVTILCRYTSTSKCHEYPAGFRLRIINGLVAHFNTHYPDKDITVTNSITLTIVRLTLDLAKPKRDVRQKSLLVVHKTASPTSLIAVFLYKLSRQDILFDICDIPYKALDCFLSPNQLLKAFIFSLQCRLATYVTASSKALARSVSVPASYIPDVVDQVKVNLSEQAPPLSTLPFRILWYGSSGRIDQGFGLIELIEGLGHLTKAAQLYEFELHCCFNISSCEPLLLQLYTKYQRDLHEYGITVTSHEWSPSVISELMLSSNLCYLPTLTSLKTFAKSANRAELALNHNLPVAVGHRDCYLELRNHTSVFSVEQLPTILARLGCPQRSNPLTYKESACDSYPIKWSHLFHS